MALGKMAINIQFYYTSYQLQSYPRTKSVLFLSSHTITVEQPESLIIDFQTATNFFVYNQSEINSNRVKGRMRMIKIHLKILFRNTTIFFYKEFRYLENISK